MAEIKINFLKKEMKKKKEKTFKKEKQKKFKRKSKRNITYVFGFRKRYGFFNVVNTTN